MGDFRDWKWQLQNRVITVEGLLPYLTPTAAEAQAISDTSEIFTFQ